MKVKKIDCFKLKEILCLWAFSLLGVMLALPYQFTLQRGFILESPAQFAYFAIGQLILYAVLLFFLVLFGQAFAERSGLGSPLLSDMLRKRPVLGMIKKMAGISVGCGAAVGLLIIILEWLFFRPLIPQLALAVKIPVWQGFLASFYGGITEEIMLRFFLMSLIVWVIKRGWQAEKLTEPMMGVAIVLSALIFGLAHLPVTSQIVFLTTMVVVRSFVLNGLAGVVFGYLYWKNGLESAMLAHFILDLVLHVIYPLFI